MRRSKPHAHAACSGSLVRVYERPERAGSTSPIGYVCNLCGSFLPDRPLVVTLGDLRPAAEALAVDVSNLLLDRQVHERVAGIVRSNDDLLRAAQTGNPFLQGMRRWWATSAALLLRRHLDGGTGNTLRDILDALVALPDGELTRPRETFAADLRQLRTISERFQPYLNALIYGDGPAVSNPAPTFNDLNGAIETVSEIASRVYAAVANVSRQMDPVIQFDWTQIFKKPWIDDTPMAYVLGDQGVPYDALPMTASEAQRQARLRLEIDVQPNETRAVMLTNNGHQTALDVRVFLPYNSTVIDAAELATGDTMTSVIPQPHPLRAYGQAVLEFSDEYDHIYRQYADVDIDLGRVRRLSPTPFRVVGRIVEQRLQGAS